MKTSISCVEGLADNRREFLKKGILISTLPSLAALSSIIGCKKEAEENISPAEDLMREHGVLNRIMIIYDTCKQHLISNEQFPLDVLGNSAMIIRNFIEEYHEKLEENFLFPRFVKANKLVDLVQVLKIQHLAGREITDQIIQFGQLKSLTDVSTNQKVVKLLGDFNLMYRPHEAREDTVLFPAIRKIISDNEYYALGEDFENKEHELFGENGFESIVEKVSDLEKQIGIAELSGFTPK
jgi:hemerythrin-like domain-containing protein